MDPPPPLPPVWLVVRSGALAGAVVSFTAGRIKVGRDPEADLTFDAEADLAVSRHHAVLHYANGSWRVRDLGSRNGTLVNGVSAQSDHPLAEGDRITFGVGGPTVDFHTTRPASAGPEPGTVDDRRSLDPALDTTTVVRENRRLKIMAVALVAVAVLAVGVVSLASSRSQRALLSERAALQREVDSLLAANRTAVVALEGEMLDLAAALQESETTIAALQTELERARSQGDDRESEALRGRLQSALAALERQQLAASVDYRTIQRQLEPALAMIWVEGADGTVSMGTAFGVRPDGTLMTNRHVVESSDGGIPERIAIQFAGSPQVWPARVLRLSSEADLALVKVDDITGDIPTVGPFNDRPDTVSVGSPVVMIGFPMGGDTERPNGQGRRRALVSVGILTGSDEDVIRVQGYGARGASGSPVMDSSGRVIGVVYGGSVEDGASTVSVVPISKADPTP